VLLHQANLGGSAINNVLFNFLFNKGADPLHGRMPDFAALPMRFNNAKAVVGHYQTLLYCKHVHARFADVPELSLASNRQIFMHNMESGFRSACSFASDVYRRPGFAPANYFQHVNLTFADAWKKICRYVFNGAKPLESVPLDPPCLRRLAEICMGEYVDAKGMSCSFIGSKALTPIERSVVDIVLTGTNLAPGQQLVIDPTLRVNSWINAFTKNMIASVELRARKAEAMRNSVMAQPSQSSRAAEEVLLPALPPYVPKTSSSREVSAPVAVVTSPADSSTALQTQQSDQTTQQIA
jgi:hypothetical protein